MPENCIGGKPGAITAMRRRMFGESGGKSPTIIAETLNAGRSSAAGIARYVICTVTGFASFKSSSSRATIDSWLLT
jgi:hypothetical protein